VVVLAAGRGTRARVFGPWLHKGLLPLGDRPVLTRLLERFPTDTHVVFAIGHLGEQIRNFVELAHPEFRTSFVEVPRYSGPGTGPATSLLACRPLLDRPFLVTASDALYDEPLPELAGNWIGVAEVPDPENWCTVRTAGNEVSDLAYRDSNGTHLAYTGTAHVEDIEPFLNALERTVQTGEVVLDPGFLALRDRGLETRAVAWRDAGNETTYAAVRSTFEGETTAAGKTNDLTYLIGSRVLKVTSDPELAKGLAERGNQLTGLAPAVLGHGGGVVASERVQGARVLDSHDPKEVRRCLDWVANHFWASGKMQDAPPPSELMPATRRMYVEKTRERSRAMARRLPELGTEARINGLYCPPVDDLLDTIDSDARGVLSAPVVAPFHGDLHAENVLVDATDRLWLIDWRTDFGGLSAFGDITYDLAKMIHTLEFPTPVMTEHRFSVARDDDGVLCIGHNGVAELEQSRQAFWSFVGDHGHDASRVLAVDALVFLSMSPLYDDRIGEYLYLLGQVLLSAAIQNDLEPESAFESLFGID